MLVVGVLARRGRGARRGARPGAGVETLANLKVTADNVQVKQKGKSTFVAAKDGLALKQGDTLKTDATGRAEIDYTDGSLTRLASSTVFTISKLTNERAAARPRARSRSAKRGTGPPRSRRPGRSR